VSVSLVRIVGHPDFGPSTAVFPEAASYVWSRNNDRGGASVGASRDVTLHLAACVTLKIAVFVEREGRGSCILIPMRSMRTFEGPYA
jgi:hypothetical protein